MASLDCERRFGIGLVLGIGIAQPFLSSIVLGIVLVCRPWYSPSFCQNYTIICYFSSYLYVFSSIQHELFNMLIMK